MTKLEAAVKIDSMIIEAKASPNGRVIFTVAGSRVECRAGWDRKTNFYIFGRLVGRTYLSRLMGA